MTTSYTQDLFKFYRRTLGVGIFLIVSGIIILQVIEMVTMSVILIMFGMIAIYGGLFKCYSNRLRMEN